MGDQKSMIFIPGSYFSLIVSMSFFIFKYSMNVCYAINPSLKGDYRFFMIDIILSGMITGIFSGRVSALIAQYLNYKEKKY